MMKEITSDLLVTALNSDLDADASYIRSLFGMASYSEIEEYILLTINGSLQVVHYLRSNDFIDPLQADALYNRINHYRKELHFSNKGWKLGCDIESASSDPDFMSNVSKAVEKHGAIN